LKIWLEVFFHFRNSFLFYSYVVLITTYSFWLWFFTRASAKIQILLLAAIQCKAALWILGIFHTLPTGGIEVLVGLTPIYLYFKRLVKWSCLRIATLSSQYVLISLLSVRNSKDTCSFKWCLVYLFEGLSFRYWSITSQSH